MVQETSADSISLSVAELGLRFGQQMALLPNPGKSDRTYNCELIGCLGTESIIIGPPADTGILPQLTEGQRVIVRVKLAGGVALFPTTVLFVSDVPTVMVYLDFPREVKFKQIRGAFRVNVVVPVLVVNKTADATGTKTGKIVDISTSGARIEMFESLGGLGDDIEIKGKFQVGEIQRVLSVDAIIRAKSSTDDRLFYGIEFHEGDEEKMIILMGFTFHAMAFGHLQSIR